VAKLGEARPEVPEHLWRAVLTVNLDDALGRRYSRANGGTTTVFYYGPGGILTEKQGANFTSAYAYGNGLIRKDGEYPMFDGLGSERTVTNSSQTVTGTIIHDAFGLTVATTGKSNDYCAKRKGSAIQSKT